MTGGKYAEAAAITGGLSNPGAVPTAISAAASTNPASDRVGKTESVSADGPVAALKFDAFGQPDYVGLGSPETT